MRVIWRSKSTLSPPGGEGIEVEELDGLGDAVFDEHALSIAGDQIWTTALALVGEQDGGILVPQFGEGDLAEGAREAPQGEGFVEDLGGS